MVPTTFIKTNRTLFMKRLFLPVFFCLIFSAAFADTNPFVQSANISVAPIPSANPYATFSFLFGNSGSEPIGFEDVDGEYDPITLIISMGNGTYDDDHYNDPVSAVGGDYKDYFSWTYNAATSTYTGKQIKEIEARGGGEITIAYKATKATPMTQPFNGFNVNLTSNGNAPNGPGTNPTEDDYTKEFTYVDGSLPVALAEFNVTKEGAGALLRWVTTEEINSSYFQVEHSTDARNWANLGTARAQGEGRSVMNYRFNHSSPSYGINYYRLKMVDLDASFEYSPVKSIDFKGGKEEDMFVGYPNPVTDRIWVNSKLQSRFHSLRVQNVSGRTLIDLASFPVNGIDAANLPAGIYILTLKSQNGSTLHQKISVLR